MEKQLTLYNVCFYLMWFNLSLILFKNHITFVTIQNSLHAAEWNLNSYGYRIKC